MYKYLFDVIVKYVRKSVGKYDGLSETILNNVLFQNLLSKNISKN